MSDAVLTEREGAVAIIRLNRPDRLNALDAPTRLLLLGALERAAADRDVRAVILTGTGRGFCVGQDLAAIDELTDARATVADSYNPVIRAIVGMAKPVIAAVNGHAVGAGMGLALACDIVLMAESASLACVFGKIALVPDSGVSWALARRLGHQRAFDLATSGRRISPAEAVQLGLANEVVPDGDLAARALARAAELAAGPGEAWTLTKRLLQAAAERGLDAMLEMEATSQGIAAATGEHAALRAAFLKKS